MSQEAAKILAQLEKIFSALLQSTEKENQPTSKKGDEEDEIMYLKTFFAESGGLAKVKMKPPHFAYFFHLYRAKHLLLQRSLTATKKELKLAVLRDAKTPIVYFLNAQLAYLTDNTSKATQLLIHAMNTSSDKYISYLCLNNLGCIHSSLKKPRLATFYFSKALKESQLYFENKRKSVPLFSKSRRLEILQNAGYQQLITGNPLLAFKCFREALAICYRQPLLWLRLSECCVAYHVKQLNEAFAACKSFVTVHDGPTGRKKYVIVTNPFKLKPIHSDPDSREASESSQSNLLNDLPSVESGIRCAQTVLNLLNKPNQNEDISLRQSALANLAYLSLAIGDPVVALNAARDLLSIPAESHFKLLGNIYAAEALCWLNKPDEAAQHLSPSILNQVGSESLSSSPYQLQSDPVLNPRFTILINLAVVNILRDNLSQANEYVNQALSICHSTSSILLRAYLDLRNGNTAAALNLLRFPHSFNDVNAN
jgi:CCR4-NOT transcription complex subunit 10